MRNKNFNVKKYFIISIMFTAGFFILPVGVKAATSIYFDVEKPAVYKGDTFIANLKISSPDEPINVIDGTILYDSNKLEIKDIGTGGSVLTLWPEPPTFTNSKGTMSFVGGVTSGFQGDDGEILKIAFRAKSEGEGKLDYLDGFSVFLHDGEGSQINPGLKLLSINILPRPSDTPTADEWQKVLEQDTTPPESFKITIGKDSSIFDGQRFITFFTTDAESGIDYYEVKEGTREYVRAESPYVLEDQSLRKSINVKAVDKAGNERIEELTPSVLQIPLYKNMLTLISVFIIILLILFIIWRNLNGGSKIKNKK